MATILVVDDLVINRRMLVALLSNAGHRLLEAGDGRAALAIAAAECPDLVITDVLMPVVNGYEFVRQLRLDPKLAAIPVLFYTAPYGEREARAFTRTSGVPYVLTKPPEPEVVLDIVGRVLSGNFTAPGDCPETPDDALDREQLQLLSDQLTTTAEELRLANARLRALINIGLDFASQRDTTRRLQRLCVAAHDLFGASYVTVGLLRPVDRRLQRVVASGTDAPSWITEGELPTGIFATVVNERRVARGAVAAQEVAGRPFPEHHPDVQRFCIAPLASPTGVHGWICLVGNDDVEFDEETEHQLLALGAHVGRIFELEREITERIAAEAALRESEQLNHNLLEHLPHRIVIKDRQSVVRFCNGQYARELGHTVNEIIGTDAFRFHPSAMAEAYLAEDQEVMTTGVTRHIEGPYVVDGVTRWGRTVKVPYRDAQGEITGVIVVVEDITTERDRELQYQQSEKMEAVGRLAGGVAHDFNNLLTAILGYCELLAEDMLADNPHRSDVLEIQTAGFRAADLTRQLLAFSRKEIIKPTILDLNAVVTGMRAMLERLIREDVKVVVQVEPDLPLIEVDRGQLEQIVLNLALNGRDAMPKGGTLTITTDRRESHVVLRVTDTGTGMAPEVCARIFEPFFTTKPVGQGTGLGLASVQGVVARCGGHVDVTSETGQGTTFTVSFPSVTADTARLPEVASEARRLTGTETVLVVEDADGLRALTSRMLRRLGYATVTAATAEEAIRACREHPEIDVLLTDVVMPDSSGPELSRVLVDLQPALRVVYMSGYTEDTIAHHGVLLPGIAFVPKPFTAETLGRTIRSVLDSPQPLP